MLCITPVCIKTHSLVRKGLVHCRAGYVNIALSSRRLIDWFVLEVYI